MMPPERSVPAELIALLPEFELLRELGRGGVAVVYLARDRELGREVALKVVRERFLDDSETAARFAREARTVARLQHPNIVAVYGARRLSNGALAMVMQHVPGCTLKQLIREQGPLPFARVERVLGDVAAALEHAHRQGVIHRDIKPENIYLHEESGRAMLADFGIAKPLDAENSLTLSGTVIGTPAYMSPEQVDGRAVDGRSDLYSLGLVAYEMLTGRRPWEGESLYSIIYKQKHEELPPLARLRPDTPATLQRALEGALRKEREQRWRDVAEFAEQLGAAASSTAPLEMAGLEVGSAAAPPVDEEESHTIRYRKPETAFAPVPSEAAVPAASRPVAPASPDPATAPGDDPLHAVVERVEAALRAGPARRVPRGRRGVRARRIMGAAVVLMLGAGATLLARPEKESRVSTTSPPVLADAPARSAPETAAEFAALPAETATRAEPAGASEAVPVPDSTPPAAPQEHRAEVETERVAKPAAKRVPKPTVADRPASRRPADGTRARAPERGGEPAPPRLQGRRVEVRLAQGAEGNAPSSLSRVEIVPRVRNRGVVESTLAAALSPAERAAAASVSLWVLVGPEGRLRDARVNGSSGSATLDAAALRAARRLEFEPVAGQVAPVWVNVALRLPGS